MKKAITAEEMLVRMAGLCANAEQCSADIREKVLKKGFSAEVADKIVDYLVSNKYIDDVRYARAFSADKVKFSGWGKLKVKMHLRVKKIPDAAIRDGLEYVSEEDYSESLRRSLKLKAKSLNLNDVKDRQKLYRHLASRGFESQLIISEIRKYMSGYETS